jgi:anhydro-N-acetylmuramic acid kinase
MEKLSSAPNLSAEELLELDANYGKLLGKACVDFMDEVGAKPDFIASHGHTIFHQPQKGFTYQLGNGNALHSVVGRPVVCDFRSLDVMLGGEGAPLVPVGDKVLFSEYDGCLNLGGIANLSLDHKGQRIAYDICFCNMGLNYLMSKVGKDFDAGGKLSSTGVVNEQMLANLSKACSPFRKKRPSLGRELFESKFKPLLDIPGVALKDKLRTFTACCVNEMAYAITSAKKNANVLCTGGGAFNSFLMAELCCRCGDDATLIIPEDDIVKFKESIVFAFLGVLRVTGETNCLKSVTGASRNSSSGVLIGFK